MLFSCHINKFLRFPKDLAGSNDQQDCAHASSENPKRIQDDLKGKSPR